MSEHRIIYCTGCLKHVDARLTNGRERYPHRPDLADIPFWKCDTCGNYVGCHWKTRTPTMPLGVIATPEILRSRIAIHDLIDPIWRQGTMKRGQIYAYISKKIGRQYHTGEIRSMDEAAQVYEIIKQLKSEIGVST